MERSNGVAGAAQQPRPSPYRALEIEPPATRWIRLVEDGPRSPTLLRGGGHPTSLRRRGGPLGRRSGPVTHRRARWRRGGQRRNDAGLRLALRLVAEQTVLPEQ